MGEHDSRDADRRDREADARDERADQRDRRAEARAAAADDRADALDRRERDLAAREGRADARDDEADAREMGQLVRDLEQYRQQQRLDARDREDPSPGAHLDVLAEREHEILSLIAEGLSNDAIAQRLHLSINTVKSSIRGAYRKAGVTTRSQAVLWYLQGEEAPTRGDCDSPRGRR